MLLTNAHSLIYNQIDYFAFFFEMLLSLCSVFKARQYIYYFVVSVEQSLTKQIIKLKLVLESRFLKEFMTRGFGYSLPRGPLISSAILPLEKMPLTNVLVRP